MPATIDVAGRPDSVDDLLVGGDARVVLAPHARLGGAVLGLEDVADLLQQPVGVELRVLDEADPLALERAGPRHVRERLRSDLGGRIQESPSSLDLLGHGLGGRACRPSPGCSRRTRPPGRRPPPRGCRRATRPGAASSSRPRLDGAGHPVGPLEVGVRVLRVLEEELPDQSPWSSRPPAIVRMCSPARTTTYCGWPDRRSRRCACRRRGWSARPRRCSRAGCRTGAAPPAAMTVTALCSGRKPRSTWSGGHGLSASFSAMT